MTTPTNAPNMNKDTYMNNFSFPGLSQCVNAPPAMALDDVDLLLWSFKGPTVDDECPDTTTSPETIEAREYLVRTASAAEEFAGLMVNVADRV